MEAFLKKAFNLTDNETSVFSSAFTEISLNKGDIFIEEGKVSNTIGFVEDGIMKCSLIGLNKEVIDDFVFENQFVANYYSFLTQTPSTKEIVCLSNVIVKVANRGKLEQLGKEYSFFERVARIITEGLFISTHKKLDNLRLLSAEERYNNLIASRPEFFNKLPQYEIASYLNVSPETISRIRKNIS